MSIKVKGLTKEYGNQKAVDNISFEINRGEIVGFLGPNGAGKSTTLKIATTYLSPTTGTVSVGNKDVVHQPEEVRKLIGYLPENNPLYLDMYVHEFLRFIGKLHGIQRSALKNRIKEIVIKCGLESEQNKLIGTLSKGFRQRVGLAQSLIHEPEVLILDEPTTGLDPNQILEIRKLIKKVSRNKTVLFSTHIMQEVQALCDKAIIINKGKIVAYDDIEKLKVSSRKQVIIKIEFNEDVPVEKLQSIKNVNSVEREEKGIYLLNCDSDIRSKLTKVVLDEQFEMLGLSVKEKTIEDIFQDLTQPDDTGI